MRCVKAASVLLGLLVVGPAAASSTLQQPQGRPEPGKESKETKSASRSNQSFRWWHDDDIKKKLGLSLDQMTQVEKIFQSSLPNLRAAREEYDRLENQLAATIADPRATEAQVSQQADLVEAARGRAGKARTMMLFKMRLVLTPEQRVKLEVLHKHFQRDNSQRRHER